MRRIGLLFICVISFSEALSNTGLPAVGIDRPSIPYTSHGSETNLSFPGKRSDSALFPCSLPGARESFNVTHGIYNAFSTAIGCPNFGRALGRYSGLIVSGGFITYGIVAQCNPLLQKINGDTYKAAMRMFPGRMHVDDYLQYVPVAAYLALDFSGVKARHNMLQRTVVAATSYLFMAAIVNTVKLTVPVLRPDGSAWNSFPSGHTATAFTGAHLLLREYKDTSPWIGIAGYAVAATTGIMRMLNRRHWLSDVVAGAGIGILSVELSYILLPVFDKLVYGKGKRERSAAMTLAPAFGGGWYGASFACVF